MNVPEIFNIFLGVDRPFNGPVQMADPYLPKIIHISPFQVTGFLEQCIWQIMLSEFHNSINLELSHHLLSSVRSLTLFKFKLGAGAIKMFCITRICCMD